MFLGIGALVNPQAIQLTRANAYTAASIVMGTEAPQSQKMQVAVQYTNQVLPKLNRFATVPQILSDLTFTQVVSQVKDAADPTVSEKIAKAEKEIGGEFGLTDHLLGIPNYLLYGGLAVAGYFYWKKKKKSGGFNLFKKPAASLVPSATAAVAPVKA